MKQKVSPAVIGIVIGVVVLAVVALGFYVLRGPSAAAGGEGLLKGRPPGADRAMGGPTAADLAKRDEYNRTHPGAVGSGAKGPYTAH